MNKLYTLTLACGHSVITQVKLVNQYPDDEHYVWCPTCKAQDNPIHPLDWQKVTNIEPTNPVVDVYALPGGYAPIMPNDILRLQSRSNVPSNRVRPFPYIKERIR